MVSNMLVPLADISKRSAGEIQHVQVMAATDANKNPKASMPPKPKTQKPTVPPKVNQPKPPAA
jgi:hypothetical protein